MLPAISQPAVRVCVALWLWLLVGCATTPYSLGAGLETDLTLPLAEGERQIERGAPNAWVDGFGHYFFSLLSKLILLDWRVNNHDVPAKVEDALQGYLWANGLCNTKVRLNQYAPGGEWRRLFRNREMPGGWRYTLGLLSVSFYTIFPERLLAGFPFIGGGDSYNPYTNTVHIYSGLRSIALHEGAHAKDFASIENRHWRGLYAGARAVPLAGILMALYQEAVATGDALSWELATGDDRDSRSAYRTLYPAYGTYLGGAGSAAAVFFSDGWVVYAVQYGIVVVGHVAGQTRALFVRSREQGLEPELVPDPLLPRADELIESVGAVEIDNPCAPVAPAGSAEPPPPELE